LDCPFEMTVGRRRQRHGLSTHSMPAQLVWYDPPGEQ
jgi:hypothetical protein